MRMDIVVATKRATPSGHFRQLRISLPDLFGAALRISAIIGRALGGAAAESVMRKRRKKRTWTAAVHNWKAAESVDGGANDLERYQTLEKARVRGGAGGGARPRRFLYLEADLLAHVLDGRRGGRRRAVPVRRGCARVHTRAPSASREDVPEFRAEHERLPSERMAAFREFAADVASGAYPAAEHCVGTSDAEFEAFESMIGG